MLVLAIIIDCNDIEYYFLVTPNYSFHYNAKKLSKFATFCGGVATANSPETPSPYFCHFKNIIFTSCTDFSLTILVPLFEQFFCK